MDARWSARPHREGAGGRADRHGSVALRLRKARPCDPQLNCIAPRDVENHILSLFEDQSRVVWIFFVELPDSPFAGAGWAVAVPVHADSNEKASTSSIALKRRMRPAPWRSSGDNSIFRGAAA